MKELCDKVVCDDAVCVCDKVVRVCVCDKVVCERVVLCARVCVCVTKLYVKELSAQSCV